MAQNIARELHGDPNKFTRVLALWIDQHAKRAAKKKPELLKQILESVAA